MPIACATICLISTTTIASEFMDLFNATGTEQTHMLTDQMDQNIGVCVAQKLLGPCNAVGLASHCILCDRTDKNSLIITHSAYQELLAATKKQMVGIQKTTHQDQQRLLDELYTYLQKGLLSQTWKSALKAKHAAAHYKPRIIWIAQQVGYPLPTEICRKIFAYIVEKECDNPSSYPYTIFKVDARIMLRYAAELYCADPTNKDHYRAVDRCYNDKPHGDLPIYVKVFQFPRAIREWEWFELFVHAWQCKETVV